MIYFLLAVVLVAAGYFWFKSRMTGATPRTGAASSAPRAAAPVPEPQQDPEEAAFWRTMEDLMRREAHGDMEARAGRQEYLQQYVTRHRLNEEQTQELEDERFARQFEIIHEEADKGNAYAQYEYAQLVAYFTDLPDKDDIELRYTRLSAEQGFVDAMDELGFILDSRYKDTEQAKQWYLRAAEKNSVKAFLDLAQLARRDKDYKEAFDWCAKVLAASPEDVRMLIRCADIQADWLQDKSWSADGAFQLKSSPDDEPEEVAQRTIELYQKALQMVPDVEGNRQADFGRDACLGLARLYECADVPLPKRKATARYDLQKAYVYLVQADIYGGEDDPIPRQRMDMLKQLTGEELTPEEQSAAWHEFEQRHNCVLPGKPEGM